MTGTGRLEAFSDGVLAIIITIMVLEMKVPHGTDLADLQPLLPVFVSYVLSFVFLGIYWNNHHHILHVKGKASVAIYALAIGLAFVRPWLAGLLYGVVAIMWLLPDRRIERVVANHANETSG